jgi:tetratricopeptide (TPR) repeat protein
MLTLRLRAFQFACAVAALLAALAPFGRAQTEHEQPSGTIEVTVSDSEHRPLAQASVTVEGKPAAQPVIGHTDSKGRYRFSALSDGTYIVRAESAGYRQARTGSVVVSEGRLASVVLVLEPAGASSTGDKAASPIEYSDEPQFTVAGVTDPTSFGAHGSGAALRTKEVLAKDTADLNRAASNGPVPGSLTPASSEGSDVVFAPPTGNASEDERIGKLLLDERKPEQALPYLDRAAKLDPGDYDVSFTLALAYRDALNFTRAETIIRALLARENRADSHEVLGDVLEQEGRIVEAEHHYERAAEIDASEPNLFAWGSELLLHGAYPPATEVFQKGHVLFPKSARMLIGLGVASYDGGSPGKGVRQLVDASDLDPSDPDPYLFLGKIEDVERSEMPDVLERLKRFVGVQPQNAMAYYYYAVGLEKAQGDSASSDEVQNLLVRSVELDPHWGDAYLQLGIVYYRRRDFARAASAYEKAIENTRLPAEAHFRLAQVYRQIGKTEEARREIKQFDDIAKERSDETERERHKMGQFVYTLRGEPTALPPRKPE